MNKKNDLFIQKVCDLFDVSPNSLIGGNFISKSEDSKFESQNQTNNVFSEKWSAYDANKEKSKLYDFQQKWYLDLYGFKSEDQLRQYLSEQRIIFDAGCGLGYKAAWFAELAPQALVIGMDFSNACKQAARNYSNIKNLFFVKGDIAETGLPDSSIDYVSCDQVIMHTEAPEETFSELARITKKGHDLACYFYAKKAVPRELLDDYFRLKCKEVSTDQLWEMSHQLSELGKTLSELNVMIKVPDIPLLGIKGGVYDVQRFIYWNFIKCFWNSELGYATSVATNFDWYSPSNARRFSEGEVRSLINKNNLVVTHFHAEPACYSGRFKK